MSIIFNFTLQSHLLMQILQVARITLVTLWAIKVCHFSINFMVVSGRTNCQPFSMLSNFR